MAFIFAFYSNPFYPNQRGSQRVYYIITLYYREFLDISTSLPFLDTQNQLKVITGKIMIIINLVFKGPIVKVQHQLLLISLTSMQVK